MLAGTAAPVLDTVAMWLHGMLQTQSHGMCTHVGVDGNAEISHLQDAPQRAQHRTALFVVHAGAHLRRHLSTLNIGRRPGMISSIRHDGRWTCSKDCACTHV